MAFFDSWRPGADEVAVQSDWERYCPAGTHSPPLILPSAQAATDQAELPLFGAASASPEGSGLPADGAGSSSAAGSGSLSSAEARDVVLFAGGPVWALDWCPTGTGGGGGEPAGGGGSAATAPPACDHLAVGAHPPQAAHNVIGEAVQGPACIQVWELSHPEQQPTRPGEQRAQQPAAQWALPRMALALAHDGGLTWHCQWLGLLAAALGDGSMRVWPVPHPQAARQRLQQGAGTPLVLAVPPVARVDSAALGGSMPCIVDWLAAEPYDLLAVGCWDGSVAIFKLVPGAAQQQQQGQQRQLGQQGQQGQRQQQAGAPGGGLLGLELLLHFPADVLPLRALRWAPPAACRGSVDLLHRHVIMTGGHEGTLRIWDLRDPFQPLYSHVLSSNSTILAGDWTAAPLGVLVAMEDASLRGAVLDSGIVDAASGQDKAMFSISWRGPGMGALWALAVQPTMQLVAYGGEDGEVGLFQAEYEANSRRRMAHTPVAAWRMEGVALALKGQEAMQREGHGLFRGKVLERLPALKSARLPDEAEAVHRVAWSRHEGGAAWLVSAGAAGLVRCQWIQFK